MKGLTSLWALCAHFKLLKKPHAESSEHIKTKIKS